MSVTPRPSQKKQATLTSFFTPKSSANGSTNGPPSSSPIAQPQSSQLLPSRKRPLEEDFDQNRRAGSNGGASKGSGRSRFERAVKRARGESSDDENGENGENKNDDYIDESAMDSAVADIPPHPASSLRSSGRTERYIYDERRAAEKLERERERENKTDQDHARDAKDAKDAKEKRTDASDDDSDDPETIRKKAELHRKFVTKLGHPDSLANIRRRNFVLDDAGGAAAGRPGAVEGDEEGAGDEEEEDARPQPTKEKKKGGKLTPMELQFLAIKRKHLDTVLVVEVGYKFKFLGEDARTAARVLGIVCIPGKMRYDEHASEAHLDRFASASIPVPRLPVHVKRLVAAGLKVGIVRQMETAALKKIGDNRNTPFVRQLTSVYTKGTYIDDLGELTGGSKPSSSSSSSSSSGYLLCLTETAQHGSGTDEKVQVGLLAVQPATGDIIYDAFEDGFMRNEVETRLLHIAPCELLLVGDLSRATEKLVQHLSGSATNVFGDRTRVERVPRTPTMASDAYTHVTEFYSDKLRYGDGAASLLDTVLKLPEPVTICLSAMITHLNEYGLQHIFDLTKYFASFTTRQHMLLNGTTLESLEVYRNTTDHGLRGSLLWALDKTQTRFGHRLLRKWIGQPLLDRPALEARVSAVEELLAAAGTHRRDKLELLLGGGGGAKTDLERSLIRIYYGKCTRPELVAVLQNLQRISSAYPPPSSPSSSPSIASSVSGFTSPAILNALAAVPAIHGTVVAFLDKINGDAARRDDKYSFFREAEESEDITNYKVGIAAVEMELDEHRAEIAKALGKKPPARPPYVTVAGIEYLVEVANTDLRRVPASWIKISGTKKASRFHTPVVVRLLSERDQHKEALAAACDTAFKDLLADIAAHYQPLRDAVAALATLDCLMSLAKVAALPGYAKPTLLADDVPPTLDIRGGRHPVAEHTLPSGYIPFSTRLGGGQDNGPKALLITGPNMGGKSSFVRAVALLTLMAQIGSYVPADAMRLTLTDAIFTRMGARDNLFAGESTFMVEVSETAAILREATPRSLVVLDELGRGTSTHDGAAIAQAVLEHVAHDIRCLTLFITHYQSLGRAAEGLGPHAAIQNVHMRFTQDAAAGEKGGSAAEEITFLYEVGPGMAHRSYGLNVARLAHIPQRVLDVAAEKSLAMEADVRRRGLQAAVRLAADVLASDSSNSSASDQLHHLISSIEQL